MTNITMQDAVDILVKRLGGSYYNFDAKTIRIEGSKIGRIDVKLEVNETSDDKTIDWKKLNPKAVIEIVGAPLNDVATQHYSLAIQDMEKAGAIGTFDLKGDINAVSTQINIGMIGTPEQKVRMALNYAINYFSPNHQAQIQHTLQIPEVRKPYLRAYSPGYMKQIFTAGYNPTPEQAFFDFFYRQTLEKELGQMGEWAWKMSEAEVRRRVKALGYPVHVDIIKLNQLKLASLFLYLVPNDPMSEAVLKQGWIKAASLIEVRNDNNIFDVMTSKRRARGIYALTEKYGVYDNDTLVSETKGISKELLLKVRRSQSNAWDNYTPGTPIMSCGRVLTGY
ncbi:hypothetical protein D3C72_1265560 [compost metagenome]